MHDEADDDDDDDDDDVDALLSYCSFILLFRKIAVRSANTAGLRRKGGGTRCGCVRFHTMAENTSLKDSGSGYGHSSSSTTQPLSRRYFCS